jgi:parallel beta-helix repeat protein
VDATFDGNGNYTGGSIIQYAIIEYAGGANLAENGALRLEVAAPYIDHNTIRHNKTNGMYAFWSDLPLHVHITNNAIINNGIAGLVDAAGINIPNGYNLSSTISGNTISNNTDRGIYIYSASTFSAFAINNNTISNNTGGGIFARYGVFTINGNTISNNTISGDGGGIDLYNWGVSSISHNIVMGNSASGNGGGIHIYENSSNGMSMITNNIITGNSASKHGGGIYIYVVGEFGVAPISNNTVSNNLASGDGGGIYVKQFDPIISNNTIINNATTQANGRGGGIFLCNICRPPINGNNLYGNTSDIGSDLTMIIRPPRVMSMLKTIIGVQPTSA